MCKGGKRGNRGKGKRRIAIGRSAVPCYNRRLNRQKTHGREPMILRIGWCALMSLVMAVPALAQTQPLRGPEPSGGSVEPDQPVRPQMPVLVPRAPQPPAAQQPAPPQPPQPPFTLTPQEEAQVDRVLNLWEERNRDIKTFDCQFKRWIYDVVFRPARPAEVRRAGRDQVCRARSRAVPRRDDREGRQGRADRRRPRRALDLRRQVDLRVQSARRSS